MVQYWEAVANNTLLPAVSAEEAAAAEAYANAAIAAAEAAMAAAAALAEEQQQQQQLGEDAPAGELSSSPPAVAAEVQLEAADPLPAPAQLTPAATPIRELPASTPIRFASGLPAGDAATPAAVTGVGSAAAATPARCTLTPLNFAAPPPTPAEGVDPQQAQQLQQLAISMAAAAVAGGSGAASVAGTPASAQRTSSRLPATPLGTPVGSIGTLAVTPLALSALRARLGGSAGGAQDAVRSRLARLKADLAAAQAKLATVDQVGEWNMLNEYLHICGCIVAGRVGSACIVRQRCDTSSSSGQCCVQHGGASTAF